MNQERKVFPISQATESEFGQVALGAAAMGGGVLELGPSLMYEVPSRPPIPLTWETALPTRTEKQGDREIGFLRPPETDTHYRATLTTQEQEGGWHSIVPRGRERPSMAQWCQNEAWRWGSTSASTGLEAGSVGQSGRMAKMPRRHPRRPWAQLLPGKGP